MPINNENYIENLKPESPQTIDSRGKSIFKICGAVKKNSSKTAFF